MHNSAEHVIRPANKSQLPTIANSFLLNIAGHENFSANESENANFSHLLTEKISCSAELRMKKVF